jgi:hypothetical protein
MQPGSTTFRASYLKLVLYGFFTLLGIILNLFVIYLFVSGQILTGDALSTGVRGGFILMLTIVMWGFFIRSSDQITVEGSKLTLLSGLFRKKATSIDLSTVSHIKAVRTAQSAASFAKQPDSLVFGDAAGTKVNLNLVNLSLKDRRRLLQLLTPTLLREGLIPETDRSQVQWLLANWDIKSPVRLTSDVDEILRKVRKRRKIMALVAWLGVTPLILLVLLIALGAWYQNVSCGELLQKGKETTARVQSVKADRTRENPNIIVGIDVAVAYEVDAKMYERTIRVSYDSDAANQAYYEQVKNSSSVQVRYLPERPRESDLASKGSDAGRCAD